MKISQGNSRYNHLKQTKVLFDFYKSQEQVGRTGHPWGVGTSGKEEDVEIGCRWVNMVEILCAQACKWKNKTC
jgi:hypothetical protein